ncbi:hypothetical protein F4806DRAFT_412695 [Annulohypoxylon nitens]|nr:hypothetical protein F4806DRAFT_412695 [Annulohypoxylon nitens]
MEIEKDCIISPERYDKFGLTEARKNQNERVKDYLNRDLMNKDAVLERFQENLLERWYTKFRGIDPVEAIRKSVCRLRDPETGYLSQDLFCSFVNKNGFQSGLAESSEGLIMLFDIFSWHAFFPFPTPLTDLGVPRVDENAFLRAVCLLVWDPAPRYKPSFSGACHGLYSGSWGPHYGWYISKRGKDSSDFLRRIFRSLAIPNSTITGKETTIPVPRFQYRQPRQEETEPEDIEEDTEDVGQQVIIMEYESERTVDILDILTENPPDEMTGTANPLREYYDPVLPTLPHHPFDLADLHIPTTKLVTLLNLLKAVKPGEQDVFQDSIASVEQLGSEGKFSWESFQTVTLNQAVRRLRFITRPGNR